MLTTCPVGIIDEEDVAVPAPAPATGKGAIAPAPAATRSLLVVLSLSSEASSVPICATVTAGLSAASLCEAGSPTLTLLGGALGIGTPSAAPPKMLRLCWAGSPRSPADLLLTQTKSPHWDPSCRAREEQVNNLTADNLCNAATLNYRRAYKRGVIEPERKRVAKQGQ
jgi:hypothetical protein